MQDLLLFVLPAARPAKVATPVARLICDRLWSQGIAPGAATAATRITESLHTHAAFRSELHFNERELEPLLDAAEVNPQTWADLLHASDLETMTPGQRKRLLATCDELITKLGAHDAHGKVNAVISDLERLRLGLIAAAGNR